VNKMSERPNVSADLVWEIARNQNAYLVKRRSGGGVQFSRDPLNLTNKHSRTHAGFINEKAVGLQANDKGGVDLITKKSMKASQPGQHHHRVTFGKGTSNQKLYKAVASHVGKKEYRSDLNQHAVARASALKLSQKEKKDLPAKKPRGRKAKAAQEAERE